jgi:glycogen synthase
MLMREPMHVCLISMEYPPETSRGGVATYTHILARALARIGERVTVIAQGLSRSSIQEQDGVTVHRIKEQSYPLAGQLGRSLGASELFGFLAYARKACAEVQDLDYCCPVDVIEAPEWAVEASFLHSRLARIPRIVRLHTPQFLLDELNGIDSTWNRRMLQRVERWHLLRSSAVTSISRSLADVVCRKYNLPPDSITVIPNPLDSALFPFRRRLLALFHANEDWFSTAADWRCARVCTYCWRHSPGCSRGIRKRASSLPEATPQPLPAEAPSGIGSKAPHRS